MMKNPPSIWLTINPADTQDLIAQVFCGEEINLDHFVRSIDRPSDIAISSDPYALASFFHLMVNAILCELLGIQGSKYRNTIVHKKGILGMIEAFIGTVKAQGCSMLHLHMVLWLQGAVPSDLMKELLETKDFCNKVKLFIATNICADMPDTPGMSILSVPHEPCIAFLRLVDPCEPSYHQLRDEAKKCLAHTIQVHQCGCMKLFHC